MPESDSPPASNVGISVGTGSSVSNGELITLSMLTSGSDVDRIRGDWERLTGESPAAFQSFGWNRAWIRHFQSKYEALAVFVLYRNSRAVGIFPCFRKGTRLRMIGDEICDFQDVIVESPNDAKVLLASVLLSAKSNGLHLDLRKLSERGMLWPLLQTEAEKYGFSFFHKVYGRCPWFSLEDSAGEFLTRSKASLRKRIRRALRRLEDLAPDSKNNFLDESGIDRKTIGDIAALHQANQHRKEGSSIFENEAYRNFLTEAAGSADVGMRVLEIRNREGELVAFDLGFERGERFYAYLGAFDELYSGGSPGMCLLHWQMDVFPLRGVRHYDFLCGEESYKFDYATETYDIISARVYVSTFRNLLLLFGMKWLRAAKTAVKPLLVSMGMV
jgi:CelD/BcsL family acetyltransferase involved in cellulose biosynthesis